MLYSKAAVLQPIRCSASLVWTLCAKSGPACAVHRLPPEGLEGEVRRHYRPNHKGLHLYPHNRRAQRQYHPNHEVLHLYPHNRRVQRRYRPNQGSPSPYHPNQGDLHLNPANPCPSRPSRRVPCQYRPNRRGQRQYRPNRRGQRQYRPRIIHGRLALNG